MLGMSAMIDNILSVYLRATPSDVAYGRSWYQAAHDFCVGLSNRHGVTVGQAAGIVAVLSPRVNWGLNQAYAEEWLTYRDVPTFFRTLDKLHAITAGGVESGYVHGGKVYRRAIAGPKVTRFYWTILNPTDASCVVVDRHALAISQGRRLSDTEAKFLDRKGGYEAVENAYKLAARRLDILPNHLQATTWVTWRAEHNVQDHHTDGFYDEF